mmetsp:Transcript_12635/g.38291  ORF Transcript_12635/g.38291 Transcript_12635/m.38291 type:complete len:407 (+) Transcript_12635:42-1262(+)
MRNLNQKQKRMLNQTNTGGDCGLLETRKQLGAHGQIPQHRILRGTEASDGIPARDGVEPGRTTAVLVRSTSNVHVGVGAVGRDDVEERVNVTHGGAAEVEAVLVQQGDHGGEGGRRCTGSGDRDHLATVHHLKVDTDGREIGEAAPGGVKVGGRRLSGRVSGWRVQVGVDDVALPRRLRKVVGEATRRPAGGCRRTGGSAEPGDGAERHGVRAAARKVRLEAAALIGAARAPVTAAGDQRGATQCRLHELLADALGVGALHGVLAVLVGDRKHIGDMAGQLDVQQPLEEGLVVAVVVAGRAPDPGGHAGGHTHQVLDVERGLDARVQRVVRSQDLGDRIQRQLEGALEHLQVGEIHVLFQEAHHRLEVSGRVASHVIDAVRLLDGGRRGVRHLGRRHHTLGRSHRR